MEKKIMPGMTIKNYLDTLALKFKDINIRYGFDDMSELHLVELMPEEIYDNNKELLRDYIDFSVEFDRQNQYPILFFSTDPYFKIKKAEMEWSQGKYKDPVPQIKSAYSVAENVTPEIFIKQQLNKLAMKFKKVEMKYAFIEKMDIHVIEVMPPFEYFMNVELRKYWTAISIAFDKLFNENISFICPNGTDKTFWITKPDMEWKAGKCLSDKPSLLLTREQVIPQQSFALTTVNSHFVGGNGQALL
ncbi:hypothetical protein [Chitinophaga sp. Cy-1792]|uniref:hypothetical protein n=1 Tax=Chitinophaga sp. Cy-1792 TaxID=2608339 RepID=UPI00141DC2E8|nr:hypothetical protein [Chitinophaga sp. Cy-1792]NIG55014.1 hypothetical protein [Chitinophaga sp. Cy-1792]